MNQVNHNELEEITTNLTGASDALVDHLIQNGSQIDITAAWGLQSRVAELQSLIDKQYSPAATEPAPDRSGSILDMEVPLRHVRGQAAALHGALCEELPGEPLVGAAEALAIAADALAEQWEQIHQAQRKATG